MLHDCHSWTDWSWETLSELVFVTVPLDQFTLVKTYATSAVSLYLLAICSVVFHKMALVSVTRSPSNYEAPDFTCWCIIISVRKISLQTNRCSTLQELEHIR